MEKEEDIQKESRRMNLMEDLKSKFGDRPELKEAGFVFEEVLLEDLEIWRKIENGTITREEFAAYSAAAKPPFEKKMEERTSRELFWNFLNSRQMQNLLRKPEK